MLRALKMSMQMLLSLHYVCQNPVYKNSTLFGHLYTTPLNAASCGYSDLFFQFSDVFVIQGIDLFLDSI